MIDVISDEAFERVKLILHGVPGGAEKALRGIISRATTTVRSKSLEGITSVYDIKAKDVRDRQNTTINMRTKKADGGIVGEVNFSGGKIPLYRFGVTPKQPKAQGTKVPVKFGDRWVMLAPGAPVKARQRKDKGKTKFHNVFIAKMKSGHIGMFERSGFDRFPITEIMGVSTPQMAADSVVLEKVEAAAEETIVKRTEQEITRILHGYGGK
ncbi:hypothetical protein FACS1894111_05750 [Clostridia bacterium]|nr:hypothetical protein FACS1894111_05750 [Clostridia bacterium]